MYRGTWLDFGLLVCGSGSNFAFERVPNKLKETAESMEPLAKRSILSKVKEGEDSNP